MWLGVVENIMPDVFHIADMLPRIIVLWRFSESEMAGGKYLRRRLGRAGDS